VEGQWKDYFRSEMHLGAPCHSGVLFENDWIWSTSERYQGLVNVHTGGRLQDKSSSIVKVCGQELQGNMHNACSLRTLRSAHTCLENSTLAFANSIRKLPTINRCRLCRLQPCFLRERMWEREFVSEERGPNCTNVQRRN